MDINFRIIKKSDYDKGYIELLKQLTTVGNIKKSEFILQLDLIKKTNGHLIFVGEYKNKIIVTGTIIIEKKIIHNCSRVAHIEDIVVCKEYRGYGLGKKIINHLIEISKFYKCYKIILNCNENNKDFYKKCGFKLNNHSMNKYLI